MSYIDVVFTVNKYHILRVIIYSGEREIRYYGSVSIFKCIPNVVFSSIHCVFSCCHGNPLQVHVHTGTTYLQLPPVKYACFRASRRFTARHMGFPSVRTHVHYRDIQTCHVA